MISHHFDDATLVARASGAMSEGMSLLIDSHLHWCKDCQERAWQAEQIGGQLLDQLAPVALSEESLSSVLARLDDDAPVASFKPRVAGSDEVPEPLAQLIGNDLDALPWRGMGIGVQQFDLNLGSSGACRLLRIKPGVSVPHHTHKGNELTMILRGSYSDDIGRFCKGDVADLDDQIKHQPIVDTEQECICLIATDAPLQFTGIMGRLAQPFIGL